jgi:hypothetical protein
MPLLLKDFPQILAVNAESVQASSKEWQERISFIYYRF